MLPFGKSVIAAITGLWFLTSSAAWAASPIEASCDDAIEVPCLSENSEVLAARKQVVAQLYKDLEYPGPLAVLKDPMSVSHVFQFGAITGRVTPLGKFSDFTGVVEYFYALSANPQNRVFETRVKDLLADGAKVAVTVELSLCAYNIEDCSTLTASEKKKGTLTETGFFVFNKQNRIISFDLNIPNLGAAFDPAQANPLARAGTIAGICAFLTIGHLDPISRETVKGGTCTQFFDEQKDFGPGFLAVPFNPFLNCVNFMRSIPYGSFDRVNSNSFTCRQVHTLLTPLRPDIHCSHVAYGGGGKCVDFPYESQYEPFDPNSDFDGDHVH